MSKSQFDNLTTENNISFRIIIKSNHIEMDNSVFNFKMKIDLKLINFICEIDHFDTNWNAIESKDRKFYIICKIVDN